MSKARRIVRDPVFDLQGGYSIAIAEIENEEELASLTAEDPSSWYQ